MHSKSDFWRERHRELGHTGWKDPFIYAYDQVERLSAIGKKLDTWAPYPVFTLDFGCGTGDFSRLLLEKGHTVMGYDPYVKPEISHPRFTYLPELPKEEGANFDRKFEAILCVTVLDHILSEDEFQKTLTFFRKNIADEGFFLLLEYALEQGAPPTQYQAFRGLNQWQSGLSNAGWRIDSIEPAPHPLEAPSPGYLHYRESIPVRICASIARNRNFIAILYPFLKRHADRIFSRQGLGKVIQSPLKLILCKPAK